MNVQKSLYQTLLRLGINMNHPPGYMISRNDHGSDLVLGCLRQEGSSMYLLLATYWMEDYKALPEPEVVVQITPAEQTATTVTCEWMNSKEIASTALDERVRNWLELQIEVGHTFRPVREIHHAVTV
jgi:hypothetical protein